MQDIIDAQRCSFCDKSQEEVRKLIASPIGSGVYVCDECVELCNDILADLYGMEEEEEYTEISDSLSLPQPSEIKAQLDKYVIGQDDAKNFIRIQMSS